MTSNVEGPVSVHVPDSTKIVCPRCNGSNFQISNTLDDPNDITEDEVFAALKITFAEGTSAQGLVALCHCGNEFVPFWAIFDVGASDGTKIVMTNLDQITTANLLKDLYLVYLGTDVNDKGKYFIVNTNTVAAPTHITPTVAPNVATDGIFMLTNILPLGFALAE